MIVNGVNGKELIEFLSLITREKEQTILEEILNEVYPGVWADERPGKAKTAQPIIIKLKPGVRPVGMRQYPLKLENRKGIKPLTDNFLKFGLLVECESEYNTPIFPIQNPDGKNYRLVQDLRAINKIVEELYTEVANPYTLLTKPNDEYVWFTVLDFKDTFFCLPLVFGSQKLFAFEWENPDSGRKTQLTWTILPSGFKNSPFLGINLIKILKVGQVQLTKESYYNIWTTY
ncbi:endogenous retrovirus group K member 25 Pol protein-like protein [Pitangus sulphuratus]|nr:endogenous retrovirus group K member 25 Pol protein-like protein [Pitangus sulphuratus]